MWNLQLEFSYLGTGLFDLGSDTFLGSNFFTRALWLLGTELAWSVINTPFFIAQHELGHGSRAAAIGGVPSYTWDGSGSHSSIFPFVIEGLIGFKSGLAYTGYSSSGTQPSQYDIAVGTGGMNNSMMYAEAVEDEIFYNTGHVLLYPSYISAKLDAADYARNTRLGDSNGGDVGRLISYWSSQGYNIRESDLELGSQIAAYASASHFALLWSFFRYVGSGDPNVYAPTIGEFKLPDFSFFQYRRGISMRSRFAFGSEKSKTIYPASIEYVYKGSPAFEVSFGMRELMPMAGVLKTGVLWQFFLCSAGGGGIRWSRDFASGSSSFFTLGSSLFNDASLEGERNGGRFVTSSIAAELWGKWTMTY